MTDKKRSFYIGTKLENDGNHNKVRDVLQGNGDKITYDWTIHGSVKHEGEYRISEVAKLETNGIRNADYIIILLPGGRGTHVELGIALGLFKRVFMFSENPAHFDFGPETCAFYWGGTVSRSSTYDELFKDIQHWKDINR